MDPFTLQNTINGCVYAVVAACLYFMCSLNMAGALQQSGYRNKKFLTWYHRKDNMQRQRYILTFLLIAFSSAFLAFCFSFLGTTLSNAISLLPFLFFLILYRFADGKYALKVKPVFTARLKRLCVVYVLLLAILNYLGVALLNVAASLIDSSLFSALHFVPMCAYILLLPYFLALANGICSLYEKPHLRKAIANAKQKLQASGAIKIGITGSYGKTSVKEILKTILSEKYRVAATPASYNTPAGIAKCVNGGILEDTDVFLAEMGARQTGDIAELCDLVCPDYGVVTGVCAQHLETFGSIENIVAEKSVLLRRAKSGFVAPSALAGGVTPAAGQKAVFVGKDVTVGDLSLSAEGTSFTLSLGTTSLALHTKLLTAHAAENIALAAAMAKMLGLTDEEIVRGVAKIDYVEHRLQVIRSGGVTILDDSYNANVVGARDAIAALSLFGGEKYVLTPGIVELGVLEKEENEKLGAALAAVDNVFLIGETLVGAVKKGYLGAGGDEEKLSLYPTLDMAVAALKEKLREGDCVLFLNDLPDVY